MSSKAKEIIKSWPTIMQTSGGLELKYEDKEKLRIWYNEYNDEVSIEVLDPEERGGRWLEL
jgi:hypothetical protein